MTMNSKVEELATQLTRLDSEIKSLEIQLKGKKEAYRNIREKDLAELMQNEGYEFGTKVILKNGRTILLKEYFKASIPSESAIRKEKDAECREVLIERRNKCLTWLNDNGSGDIIKNVLTANFAKEEAEKAKQILKLLLDKGINCSKEESVHWKTLSGTLQDLLAEGKLKSEDFDLFKIASGPIVDLK